MTAESAVENRAQDTILPHKNTFSYQAVFRNSGFSLNYNSQLWRRDGNHTWSYGRDVGYGYGWRLLAGSLTPIYGQWGVPEFFLYTDSTGAEYRLDRRDANGVWTGGDGSMLSYEEATGRLRFNDGTFWFMGAESGGAEPDAGTRYPTVLQDTNGNQIQIDYAAGQPYNLANSSARITKIWDGRSGITADSTSVTSPTWTFAWSNGHLVYIIDQSSVIHRTLTYTAASVKAPFAADTGSYGSTQTLASVSTGGGKTFQFQYGIRDTSTTGELTLYILPYGGAIRWELRDFTYTGSRTAREIFVRYLQAMPGGAETRHIWWRDDTGDSQRAHHAVTSLWQDTPAGEPASGDRVWWFDSGGKLRPYQERAPGALVRRQTELGWKWIDEVNKLNPYVWQTISKSNETGLSITDGGAAVTTVATQQLDAYGNVVSSTKEHSGVTLTTTISYLHQSGRTRRSTNRAT